MIKFRDIFLAIFAFLLCGCKYTLLDPKGMIASAEKNIMITSIVLMLIVVIPVIILTFVFSWRYRDGNTKATYSPDWAHSTLLEIIWWSVPCVIVCILGAITWISTYRLDPYKPLDTDKKTLVIQAISLEWKWLFIYPDKNIATINFVQIPAGVPVRFLITAEGPMNSFQIPQLAGQIYAMAGMQTKLNLIADVVGDYRGMGTNFSGDGFSEMNFTVRVSSQDQFNQWVKLTKQSPSKLTIAEYNKLVQPSQNNTVKYFSSANKEIFANAIMKSMMPMPELASLKK